MRKSFNSFEPSIKTRVYGGGNRELFQINIYHTKPIHRTVFTEVKIKNWGNLKKKKKKIQKMVILQKKEIANI